MKEAELVGWF